MEPGWYTLKEAAVILFRSVRTIRRYATEKHVLDVRILRGGDGRRIRLIHHTGLRSLALEIHGPRFASGLLVNLPVTDTPELRGHAPHGRLSVAENAPAA